MLGWCSLAAERISRRKRSSDAGPADQVAADDLEHLLAAHQRVLGQVDDAHPAAAQLAEDPVVGVVGQAGRERVGRRRLCGTCLDQACRPDPTGACRRHSGRRGYVPGTSLPTTRQFASAVEAALQMLLDGVGQATVELAQTERAEYLATRMARLCRVHREAPLG